jgi:hypothetical protein
MILRRIKVINRVLNTRTQISTQNTNTESRQAQTYDRLLAPKAVECSASESEGHAARSLRVLAQHIFDEPPVVVSLPTAEGYWVDPLAAGESTEGRGSDEAPIEMEEDLIGESVREDIVKVVGNVGGSEGVGSRQGRYGEGQGEHPSLFGEDERILYRRFCPTKIFDVSRRLDGRVLGKGHESGVAVPVLAHEVVDALKRDVGTVNGETVRDLRAGEEADIEKLVCIHAEVLHDGALGNIGEGELLEIDGEYDLVDALEEKQFIGAVHGVNVRLWMALEIHELKAT